MLPSENELRARYSSYSNKRLLAIVHHRDQYTTQALQVAKSELANRNITAAEVDIFLDEQEQRQLKAETLACIPLTLGEKTLFFFLWFAPWFVGGARRMNFEEDGFILKDKQSKTCTLAGFISFLLDAFVSIRFSMGISVSIVLLMVLFLCFLWFEKKIGYQITF